MIYKISLPDDWPTPEDYEDWQNLRMSKERQTKFFTCLYSYCIRRYYLFSNIREEDYEELAQDAVIKHAKKFQKEKGTGKSLLQVTLLNKVLDFRDSKHQKYASARVYQTTKSNSNNEDDDLVDLLEEFPGPNFLDYISLEKNFALIDRIWRNREKLPAYKWKDSFFIFLEIILSAEEAEKKNQIYQIAKNDYGLIAKEKTFYVHVTEGTQQFKRWLLGEDEIPLNI